MLTHRPEMQSFKDFARNSHSKSPKKETRESDSSLSSQFGLLRALLSGHKAETVEPPVFFTDRILGFVFGKRDDLLFASSFLS